MSNLFQSDDLFLIWLFVLVFTTGFLLICALFMKYSHGLFFSRTIDQYQKDRHDPKFKKERSVGTKFSEFILKYLPPIFINLVILLILKTISLI